jgi:hypothetical protein
MEKPMICKRLSSAIALLIAAACSVSKPPTFPPPGPTPGPTQPPDAIAILTVKVTPCTAIVQVGSQEWATRPDCTIVEEFKAGAILPVTAKAQGFITSDPIQVTMTAGLMQPVPISLQPVPVTVPALGIAGKHFTASGKPWAFTMVSGLALLSKTPAEQAAYLDWVKAKGFEGVRVFAGALTWANQTPDSARAALPGLLDRLTERGLVVEVTALTDTGTGYDQRGHLTAVADILAGRKGVLLELANEVGNPTQAPDLTLERLRAWGNEIVRPRGVLWAIGSTGTDEPCPPKDHWDQPDVCKDYAHGEYPAGGGDYSTAHLDRGRPTWNNVRRVREIYAIADESGRPSVNNEPMGADELDGSQTGKQRWNDPALFFALGALDRAFMVGGVHHSEAGRYAVIPGPVQNQCAEAYLAGHKAVDTVLQGLVGSYRNVGHQGSPVGSINVDGVVRAYSFIVGNIGVTVAVGLTPNHQIQWQNGYSPTEVASMTGQDGRRIVIFAVKQ